MRTIAPLSFCTLVAILLSACQNTPPEPVEAKAVLADARQQIEAAEASQQAAPSQPPQTVLDELMPELANEEAQLRQSLLSESRFDVSANKVPAKAFFTSLVADTLYSVALHPDVSGDISLNLKNATLAETLEVVAAIYGYDIRKRGNVMHVYPAGLRTETFTLDYLHMQRLGVSRTTITSTRLSDDNNRSGSNNNVSGSSSSSSISDSSSDSSNSSFGNNSSGGTRIQTETNSYYWKELEELLMSLISSGKTSNDKRSVVVSPQTGLVTVTAYPDELRQVREYLAQAEQSLQRQVLLEARIIEVTLADEYQQGINWSKAAATIGNTALNITNTAGNVINNIAVDRGGVTSIAFQNSDFEGVIELLDTQGNVNVLSSPRITAANNQKAVIKVGQDEYFVTNFSATTVTGTATSTTPDVELTPFFSGIALDVMPQINQNGQVLLHVHPSITDVQEQTKVITVGQESIELPLARSDIRESDTVIKARSGDVVVIGGLMKTIKVNEDSQVPVLGNIPVLGNLFKNKRDRDVKTELVILIKPTIVTRQAMLEELQRSERLINQWYPSGDNF